MNSSKEAQLFPSCQKQRPMGAVFCLLIIPIIYLSSIMLLKDI